MLRFSQSWGENAVGERMQVSHEYSNNKVDHVNKRKTEWTDRISQRYCWISCGVLARFYTCLFITRGANASDGDGNCERHTQKHTQTFYVTTVWLLITRGVMLVMEMETVKDAQTYAHKGTASAYQCTSKRQILKEWSYLQSWNVHNQLWRKRIH